jgi:hypothetical protein
MAHVTCGLTMGFSHRGDEKRPFHGNFLHHTNFKTPKNLYKGQRLTRSFLASQPRLALAGENAPR